ncbi:MAG TPA: HAMP domain-containing sensor histidine kinase [Planctomycetota bacterium]|nr:HAMP domain-containing sensor histidine kinase [Planctomycetota bacterium]
MLVLLAAALAWGEASAAARWVLAGAVAATAAAWWALHRHAAQVEAQRAEYEHIEARLEQLPIAQDRFVANLAHEIRSPLSIVLSQAELILGCCDDPVVVKDTARSIVDQVLHSSALVDGFLRLEGPFVPGDTSRHVPVPMHDSVLEAVRRCQAVARGRGVGVTTTLSESDDEDLAPEVLGDAVLLEAMIESLLRHAVRRTPRGAHVELRVDVRGGSVLLRVRDHGPGIAPAQLESMFDWFFQQPGGSRRAAGPGVGLAIARRIAEHHRGTISLRNHARGGCEFEVSLPRWRGETLPLHGDATSEASGQPDPQRPGAAEAALP